VHLFLVSFLDDSEAARVLVFDADVGQERIVRLAGVDVAHNVSMDEGPGGYTPFSPLHSLVLFCAFFV
jgi:hypothetical protein